MSDGATREIELRPMRDDEYDAFHDRSVREYAEEIAANAGITVDQAMVKSLADFARFLPARLESPDQHLFVIVDAASGEALGELWFGLSEKPGGIEAFGYDFWVRPDLRDAGIGRRTMRLAAAQAKELGAVRLALNVFGDNPRARHLYESFGFTVTSTNMSMALD